MLAPARWLICALAWVAAAMASAFAQGAYPTRNVEIIVSYGPGGSTDIVARLVAQKLQERLGQSFVVLNRPGAGGVIGMICANRSRCAWLPPMLTISCRSGHIRSIALSWSPA